MKKLEVWAYATDARDLSRRLVRQKCVDVSTVPIDSEYLTRYDSSESKRAAEQDLARYEKVIKILTPFSASKKSNHLESVDDFKKNGTEAAAEKLCNDVLSADERRTQIEKEIAALQSAKSQASPWLGLDVPLGCSGTKTSTVLLGSISSTVNDRILEEALSEYAAAFRQISFDQSIRNMLVICANQDQSAVQRTLSKLGFTKYEFAEDTPVASQAVVAADKKIKELRTENNKITKYLVKCGENIDDVRVLWDIAKTHITEAEMRERMAATADCVLLRGFVPEETEANVVKLLSKMDTAYELSDPAEEEYPTVPVKLKNNALASCFEWVVGMYSLPVYGSYDPTAVMSIFYIILFATMMADVGYGLLLIIGGFLGPKLMKADKGLSKAMNMFGWCGVGCIITGALFGGWFGNMPSLLFNIEVPALVDPVSDPISFLILGIALGFVHLVAGQVIKFCITWKESKIDAICDNAFYWIIYAGIIMLVLVPGTAAYIVLGTGAALVILTAGRKEKNWLLKPVKGLLGLYGLINFGSDLISYARILAIALSGSVLAQVFNVLASISDSPSYKYTAGILILIFGHVLNCVLSSLSGFVHTSRLQYVEFFGKFYRDGGIAYAPMLPSEKFSKI